MNEVAFIVEGLTEQTFVRDILAPHLARLGISAWARLVGAPRHRGGVRPWESVRTEVITTLKERKGRFCTTMFDFYAMPRDWPARTIAAGKPHGERGVLVEAALLRDVAREAGPDFRQELFIPYVQVHEFEAILFSDTRVMAAGLSALCGRSEVSLAGSFEEIVSKAGDPEAINDGAGTAPSKRILGEVTPYRKNLHGPTLAARIGIPNIRRRCRHFDGWLQQLESLAR